MVSAFQDWLNIKSNEIDRSRIDLAASLISNKSGNILIDNWISLVPEKGRISCEVVHSSFENEREEIYTNELEKAKKQLMNSVVWPYIKDENLEWMIVGDTGMGRVKLWPDE